MPIQLYFDTPFANAGDKTSVPGPIQGSGSVSYTAGYGILYSTAVGSGGYNFPRAQHNQILFDITSAIQYIQQNGCAAFISTTMNGGTPYSYKKGAVVSYDPGSGLQNYVSLVTNNLTLPTTASWAPLGASTSPLFSGGTTTGSGNAQATTTTQGGCVVTTAGNAVTSKAGFSNTGAMTLNTDSSSAITVKKNSTSGLIDLSSGDIVANNEYFYISNGTNWVLINPSTITATRTRLTTGTTFFVATTGNDSTGNGSSGAPWATIQHAYDYIQANIDIAGFSCTVSVADGTYTAGLTSAIIPTVGGVITLTGNTATPTNCVINSTSNPCFAAYYGCSFIVGGGFKLTSSTYMVLARGSGANIQIVGNMNYGAGGGSLIGHLNAFWGGFIESTHDYTISGGAGSHYQSEQATVRVQSIIVTLTGTPAFADAFAYTRSNGTEELFPITWSGAGSGAAYSATLNGVINTNGGGLPSGLSGGSTSTGGQYA